MKRQNLLLGTSLLLVAGTLLINFLNPFKNNERLRGNINDYEIRLTSDNAPSNLTNSFGEGSGEVRYTTINYENARLLSGYHVELNAGGLLYNPLTSQITSITSVSVSFVSSGSLYLATSYDGSTYSQSEIYSDITVDTTSKPYFFKLVATDNVVKISSVSIIYSCVPHDGEVVNEKRYEMFFDYTAEAKNVSGTYTGNISNLVKTTGDFALSTLTPANVFAEKAGANDAIRFSSSNNAGSLTFTFDRELSFNSIIIETRKYSNDSATVKIVSSTNTTGVSFTPNTTNKGLKTIEFNQSGPTNTISLSTGKTRFYLHSITLVAPAEVEVIDTGISANDAKTAYFTTDVYANTNQLDVKLLKSSGPAQSLSYDASGVNGYKYVLRNSALEVVSHTNTFNVAGTYYVDVSYKTFNAPRITISVSDALPPANVTSLTASESKLEYQIGDVYLNSNQLKVTAFYDNGTSKEINYNADGINGYNFTFYDPDLNDHYPNNPFTIVGDYIFTVSYKGKESNDITISVGEKVISEATIKIKTNSIAEGTRVTEAQMTSLLDATDVTISKVEISELFGGFGGARVRLSSNATGASIKFTFANALNIRGISLDVSDYKGKTAVVKVMTTANTTGQSQTVSSGVSKLTYDTFSSDTEASTTLTISNAAGNQFFLHGINITIGSNEPIAVTGLSLENESLSIGSGKRQVAKASVIPSNATNKALTWTSDNEEVATVSDGEILGVSVGTANINVTTVDGGFTKTIAVTISEVTYNNFSKATEVDKHWNLQDLKKAGDLNAIPTTSASQNILVIPIEIKDYPFTNKTITDINTLFNGTSSDTNYWESVKSFYDKSSFGNQNLTFTIADKYVTNLNASEVAALNAYDAQYFTDVVVRQAVSDYKTKNGNTSTQNFDSDNDGFIDAVWMIYSAPNYSNSTTIKNISTDYWAYVFWDYNQKSNLTSPVQNAYAWASYDFMYEGGGVNKIDGHTYIHETGHLLGLDDYYNYDDDSSYSPMGGVDMMDYNVIDHNVWTKMTLGWQKPYVVTGDADITINPSQDNGDAILIADNWNGTSYDEFMMVEFYTPTGLNTLDSTTKYNGSYPLGFTEKGIRIMHVDSRIGKKSYSSTSGWYFNGYFEPTTLPLSGNNYYDLAHSNTPSFSAEGEYRLIHTIQATNENTYKNGGEAKNADLFQAGDHFTMETFGANFFHKKTTLNNGNALGYTIEILSISDTEATIRIHKI